MILKDGYLPLSLLQSFKHVHPQSEYKRASKRERFRAGTGSF